MSDVSTAAQQDLNPNDPKVYTNPELLKQLDPRQQMIAIINMAQSGHMVNGNQVMTLEAILAGAGYQVSIDGSLSSDEMAALQNFEDKLNDKHFKDASVELIKMALGTAEGENPVFPVFGAVAAAAGLTKPEQNDQDKPSIAQSAAAKVIMKLMA